MKTLVYGFLIPSLLAIVVLFYDLNAKVKALEDLPSKVCELQAFMLDNLEDSTKKINE